MLPTAKHGLYRQAALPATAAKQPVELSTHLDCMLLRCTLLNSTASYEAALYTNQPNQLPADHHSSILTCLVHLGDDGGADLLNLLLLVFKLVHLGQLVAIQPLHGFIHSLLNLALIL